MNVRSRFSVFLTAVALSAASLFAQESYSSWNSYRTIKVNTTAGGANVAGTVANYPLAVRLNASQADVFAKGGVNGASIRFTAADGITRLKHEREMWDSASQTAVFWVLVPSVAGNSNTSIRMYYGKAGVADSSSSTAVFDTTTTGNAFRAVYHMSAGTGAATEKDATALGNNLAASDSVPAAIPTDTVGAIGRARTFKGDTATIEGRQYFVAPGTRAKPELNWGSTNSHTVSAWVFARSIINRANHGNSIINKGDNMYALQVYGGGSTTSTTKKWESAVYSQSWRQIPSKGTSLATTGSWKYIVGTWSGGATSTNATGQIFIDGVLDSTATTLAVGNGNQIKSWNLFVGVNPNGGGLNSIDSATTGGGTRSMTNAPTQPGRARYWDGHLDEIRLAQGVRSADWVKLDFETQKPAGTAVTVDTAMSQQGPITNFAFTDAAKAADTVVWTVGVPVNLGPTYTGGPLDSCAITSTQTTLPAGITFDKATCRFVGTPTATITAANRTITAYSSFGNVTRTVRRSAVEAPASALKYSSDTASYLVGVPINANVPSWNGRALTAFTVNPALPAGLALNASTGAITGTPSAAVAAANYTVQGTNTIGPDSLNATVRITTTTLAAEDYTGSAWPNKQVIWLNTQSNGAAVTSGQSKFPTLIRLDSSNFNAGFAQAGAGGKDLRFTKPNNTTRLPHQIERWDAAGKKAEIWVLVDTVMGSRLDSIRMHWGNVSAPDLSSGPQVFDTANGFQAVWHMSAATGGEADATANGFGAVGSGAPGTGVGSIGPARTFNGTSQFFHVPGTAAGRLNFTQADSYTLSSWMNPTAIAQTTNTGHKIIDKGDNQYVLATYGADASTRFWEITIRGNNAWNQCQADGAFAGSVAIPADSSVGAWHHLVGTYTGGAVGSPVTQRLYYDGKQVAECPISNDAPDGRNENFNVHLGVQAAGTAPGTTFSRHWNGLLDEPRLSSRPRSGDWIKLEYANQRPTGQNFVAFTRPGIVSIKGALAGRTGGDLTMKAVGRGMAFRLETEQGFTASLALVDVWGRTVWSGDFVNGALSWNGRTATGSDAAPGLYLARVTVRDAAGKTAQTLNRRVPYTR